MSYQDKVAEDGTVTTPGYRSCEDRWAIISRIASGLRRPFTALDLGAASGYFSLRLTREFGARCVAVDSAPDILAAEGAVASVVRREVDPIVVRRFGTHDIVLGLSFLHHVKDWRMMLEMMNRSARSALIIETPNPRERLRSARNRKELWAIEQALLDMKMEKVGEAPGVWAPKLPRSIYVLRRSGLPVRGQIFSGSGSNGLHTSRFSEHLASVLGYVPFPGSLNVRTPHVFRLGAWAGEYVDARRGRGGRKGGDYQFWCARVEGWDGPAHVMRPGVRGHGRNVLEVWAPVQLKEALGLRDGDPIMLRVGA